MKNARVLLGAIVLCVAPGCRKDLSKNSFPGLNESTHIQNSTEGLSSLNADGILASDWQSPSAWTEVNLPTHTVYYTHLKAPSVNNYPGQQIVRVFKNLTGQNAPQSLPFEDTINGTRYYWYYTITHNNVMIAVDVYGSPINPGKNHHFKTIAFTFKSSASVPAGDQVKSSLSKLSYEKIDALITR